MRPTTDTRPQPWTARVSGAAALGLIAVALAGCGPVEADHPLDPDTPRAQQQPSRLAGQLIAPGGGSAELFADARVELWTAADGPDDTVVSMTAYAAPIDAAGRFRFDAVTPGTYRLDASADGLAADPLVLTLPAGEVIDIGPVVLEPLWGTVIGRVLDDAGQTVPAAVVSIGDSLFVPDGNGRFEVAVPAGAATITAEAPGHEPARRALDVEPGIRTTVGAPLVLVPRAATLTGRVELRRFATDERRAAITLELDDAGDIVAPVDGRFTFDDLAPGAHRIIARANGYDPEERQVVIAAGDRRELDPIELLHASTGPDAVRLTAIIESADGGPVAGVTVAARINTVPFATAVSDRDGRIDLAAARDDRYWLDVDTAGFAPASLGPLIYAAEHDAFRGIEGDRPRLVLQPLP